MALKVIDDAVRLSAGPVSSDEGARAQLCLDPGVAARRWPREVHSPRHRQAGAQEARVNGDELDQAALGQWLEANVEGLSGPSS